MYAQVNRLDFFRSIYMEELEAVEDLLIDQPWDNEIAEEWVTIARVINEIDKQKEALS